MSHTAFRESFDRAMRWLAPLPPPHHRWIAATKVATAGADNLDLVDDPAVVEAVKYVRALGACTTDDESAAVQVRWPAIRTAQAIFEGDGPRRWALEAWILTAQPDDDIAARCGLSRHAVAAYEALFFARREYLSQPEWLAQKMFGPFMNLTFRNEEVSRFWAWVGLTGPRAALNKYIETFHSAWWPGVPAVLSLYLQPSTPASLSAKALVATHVLPANHNTAIAWAAFRLRLIESEGLPDPRQREVASLRLKQDLVRYTAGVLAGRPPEKLRHLLRLGKRKTGASVELSPEAVLVDLIAKLKVDRPPREAGQGGAASTMQHKV
jgi:hypothetical protein